MGIVDRIRALCEEKGITINKLEKEADIGRGNVARWGKHRPNIDKIQRVADYFGVSADYILTGNENKPAKNGELGETEQAIFNMLAQMTGSEHQEVCDYMEYILSKRQANGGK